MDSESDRGDEAPSATLSDGEQSFRLLVESVKDYAIVMLDPQGRVLRWNDGARILTGYTAAEIVGQPVERLYPPEAIAEGLPARLLAFAAATGRCEAAGCRLAKSGARFHAETVLTALRSPAGRLVGFAEITRDISERIRAEEGLRARDAMLSSIAEASPDAIIAVDAAGYIRHMNRQVTALFGYTRDELLGQPLGTLVPERLRDAHAAHLRAFALTPTPRPMGVGRSFTARRRDGSEFPVEIALSAERTAEGLILIAAIRDITERLAVEMQLRQSQKMEAIGALAGGMAHDFNNILGIVIGNLDLLQDRERGNASAREFIGEALDAALHGVELNQRLLAFARQQPLRPQPIDLNRLIAASGKFLGRVLGADIEILLDLDEEVWPVIVDPAQLEASLINLATNARDAMPAGGYLSIATGNRHLDADYAAQHAEVTPGDYAMIEVSDTGTGMPAEIAGRIFEPFFTTQEAGKGTGLGLAMVFGFIKQSAGHINVYSEAGMGTTFRLYVPRADADAVDSAPVPEPPTARGGGERVLVVEDNANLRRVVVRQLGELGYRVDIADNAKRAIAVLQRQKIDLVLTDIVMPGGISGYQLADIVRARWPATKIVLTSGFPQRVGANERRPGLHLLLKPYRRDELSRTLRAVLDG